MSRGTMLGVGTESWSWSDDQPAPATVVVERAIPEFVDAGRRIYLDVGRGGVGAGIWLTRQAWEAMYAAGCRADDAAARQEMNR